MSEGTYTRSGRRKPAARRPRRPASTQEASAPQTESRPHYRSRRSTTERTAPTRLRAAIGSVLALLACLALLGAAMGGVFKVRAVHVVGANLPVATIVAASDVMGKNIFRVRSDTVIDRLTSVREITVTRVDTSLPDSVTIYAQRRIPYVAWQDGPAIYLLDREGHVIAQVPRTSLPVIVGTNPTQSFGSGVVQAIRYAMQVVPTRPNGNVAQFRFDPKNGLSIVGRGGWTAQVGFGSPQTLVNRIATLAAFLDTIKTRPQHLQFVDLRYRVPYARFSNS